MLIVTPAVLRRRAWVFLGVRLLVLAVGVAVASLIGAPRAAVAQDASQMSDDDLAMGGLGWSLRRLTIEAMADALKLPPEQRKVVMDLFSSYQGQARDAAKRVTEFQQSLGTDAPGMPSKEDMKKMMEALQNFADHAKSLEGKFLEDFRTTLTAEQAELWPKAERRKRLADVSSGGPLGGGTVDLVGVARSVMPDGKLPEEAAAAIDQYEQEMDAAITPYMEWRKDLEKKLKQLGEELGEKSMEEQQAFGMKMMKEMQEKTRPALDVNNRSLSKLAAVLPENARDRFEMSYYRSAYFQFIDQQGPSVDKAFDAAMKLDGLTEDQKKSVAEIRAGYDREALALYRELAQMRDKEMKDSSSPDQMWGGQSMRDFYEKGPKITRAAVEKVRAALPAEMLQKLPAPFKPVEVKEPTFEE